MRLLEELKTELKTARAEEKILIKANWEFMKNHRLYIALETVAIVLFCIVLISAIPAKAEILIVSPVSNDGSTINTNFTLDIYINDSGDNSNVKSAEAMVVGYTWTNLIQISTTHWTGTMSISDYPAGTQKLSARYWTYNETSPHYVTQPTTITLKVPATPTPTPAQYGSAIFTVVDYFNNPISGVTVQPIGNTTDSAGKVIVSGQLNTAFTYTFTKPGYNENMNTATLTYTDATPITRTFTLRKSGDNLRSFTVSGVSTYVEQNSLSYVKVKDSLTGEYIGGAQVTVMSGSQVKSIPGTTVYGRATVAYNEAGTFDLLIEKEGYNDYIESITVLALKATPTPSPTPTPAPTPIPTPVKIWRPDVGQYITDDEYRAWMADQENKTAQQNAASINAPPPPPPPPEKTQYIQYAAVGALLVIGGVSYYKSKKSGKLTEEEFLQDTDTLLQPGGAATQAPAQTTGAAPGKIILKCPGNKCDQKIEVDADLSPAVRELILAEHSKKHEV